MKNHKVTALLIVLLISGTIISFPSFKSDSKTQDSQICYGPSVTTDNLHNSPCAGVHTTDYGCYANSLFKKYTLTVSAPAGWHFTGQPYVNLVSQDQDAKDGFTWNNFPGAHDRFFITQQNPNSIVATCWAGSHPMEINLACEATQN